MNDDTTKHWDEVRERLSDAREKPAAAASRVDARSVLKARAHDLAREPAPAADPRGLIEIVEFELAGERYGIELACVREVCVLQELTPVPCAPPFVLGIINLRGEIHTVIDLKKFFDLPDAGLTELNKVLILDSEEMRVGILADVIGGVRTLALDTLEPGLPTLTGLRASYLRGVTGGRLIVLDAARILASEAILVRDEAES